MTWLMILFNPIDIFLVLVGGAVFLVWLVLPSDDEPSATPGASATTGPPTGAKPSGSSPKQVNTTSSTTTDAVRSVPRDTACPRCHGELVTRQNKKTGTRFLGCRSYPACTFTRPLPAAARRGTGSKYRDEDHENLDELARGWGWNSWSEFSESIE